MLSFILKLLGLAQPQHKYTTKRDSVDPRDHQYTPSEHVLDNLPGSKDLRSEDGPIFDQGELGSCTANGWLGLFMFVCIKAFKQAFMGSRLFLYYNERALLGTVNEDSGAEVRDGAKSLAKDGVCSEDELPYDISTYTQKPSDQCYTDAQDHKIVEYMRIRQDEAHLKACIAEGFPFVFGFNVYASFESMSVARTGVMPMPKRGEKLLGGHCVVGVGYTDGEGKLRFFRARDRFAYSVSKALSKLSHGLRILTGLRVLPVTPPANCIICRNSWGVKWGDKGYFYMPMAFITNSRECSDFWTVRQVTNGKQAA